ncbi:unnamed protein product [Urochloa decumbens]|uniref:BHLH domain-containing protein n=1 Tax=Urochloa decumbens TaxID=240449 RepID=A0ABC9A797_9POAL
MADPFFYFGHDAAAAADEDYLMSLGLILPPAPAPPAVVALPAGSAFEAYQRRRAAALPEPSLMGLRGQQDNNDNSGGGANVHRRMYGYLARIGHHDAAAGAAGPAHPAAPADEAAALAASSSPAPRSSSSRFRHITRERLRRERLSQGFADLHALLPPGASSKGAKNDIVGAAAGYIRELEGRKERLRARNQELLERAATGRRMGGARNAAAAGGGGDMAVVKVRAESGDHATAVDAFETVLRRLKAMGELRVTAVRSCFCGGGMWMDVGVEGQVSTREVDKAITNALTELAGNELGRQDTRSCKPSFSCKVESGVPMG